MANPNAVLSRHIRVEAAAELATGKERGAGRDTIIALDDGRRVRLNADEPKAAGLTQVLRGLEELGAPVYFEVDPETQTIERFLIPNVGRVTELREGREGLEVAFDSSHAILVLKRERSDFAELEAMLREASSRRAPLIVAFDERQDIVDLRFFEPGPEDGPFPDLPELPPRRIDWIGVLLRWHRWRIWPWRWWFGCVSPWRAQQVFDAMSATTCDPATVPSPCIPFLYPDDGCWARAHEMCRLMAAIGLKPRKVWISGWPLDTPTRNHPNCAVRWGWHVAPTLCVRREWWRWWLLWWGRRTMVIDPSLFTTPVTVPTWKGVQGNPSATLTYTDASDYRWGETDPTYAKTADRLAHYRLQLQARALTVGPPPYAHCP